MKRHNIAVQNQSPARYSACLYSVHFSYSHLNFGNTSAYQSSSISQSHRSPKANRTAAWEQFDDAPGAMNTALGNVKSFSTSTPNLFNASTASAAYNVYKL